MNALLDAARQALNTLNHIIGMRQLSRVGQAKAEVAAEDLRTAIAEAEKAEPPEWAKVGDGTLHGAVDYWQEEASELRELLRSLRAERDAMAAVLYARQPLTDEQIAEIFKPYKTGPLFVHLARAVERAHGIGGSK